MTNKTKVTVLISALVLIAMGFLAFRVITHLIETDPQKARLVKGKMPVSTALAKVSSLNSIIGASGQTKEFETVTLTSLLAQPVKAVSVRADIGDRVKKGQVLVGFETNLLKAASESAKENIHKTKTDLANSSMNYQRFLNLYKQELIAKAELEKAEEAVNSAKWAYSTALQQMEKATQDMNNANLSSPISAVILERKINPGESPKLGEPLFTLGLLDHIFMMAMIAEDKISFVHMKQPAEVTFDAFPNDIFKGEVVKIDPKTDPKTRTFVAYIRIPNGKFRLTPGLTGFARVYNPKTSLTVPSTSVLNPIGENPTVFVLDANATAHLTRVKTGASADGLTEIIEGLREGDRVVAAGIEFLKDGDRVNIMDGEK